MSRFAILSRTGRIWSIGLKSTCEPLAYVGCSSSGFSDSNSALKHTASNIAHRNPVDERIEQVSRISHVAVLGDESSCRSSRLSGLSATCTASEVSKEDQRTRNGTEGFVGMNLGLRTRWVSHADVVRNPGGSQLTRAHCCHEAQRPSVVL